ncbi:MAG: response regulator [Elusimicrobia bacterium]|nr:MAG: response regulator [Elusimicrobiota bacterium]
MTSSKKIQVLVIDDDEAMIELLEGCLSKIGYEVTTAPDGLKGINAAEKMKPDLVILDLLMPGMHGFDVCQKMRENPNLLDTKILISSGKGYAVDVKAAKLLGADDYIVKPYEIQILFDQVEALVGKP